MHTYGDACEMTEMTKSPLSGLVVSQFWRIEFSHSLIKDRYFS